MIRIEAGESFGPIKEALAAMDEPIPNELLPHLGFVMYGNDGEVQGFAVLQTVPLVEPFVMKDEPEAGIRSARLFKSIRDWVDANNVPRVFCHTECPKMQAMLERAGAREVTGKTYEVRSDWLARRIGNVLR